MQDHTVIRPATDADLPSVLDLWNPYIRTSHATFNSTEKTANSLTVELAAKAKFGQPFYVAADQGEILGFATYTQFRASNGYTNTVENTIFLAEKAAGKGLGRRLMDSIETHARNQNHHSMLAGISHRNPSGIDFHTALGFVQVARLPEVGYKFNQWYDLILMQKFL
ncbi:MAG: L-amino acid N-acyltransferase YncA [Paracoccaceae bacterium]